MGNCNLIKPIHLFYMIRSPVLVKKTCEKKKYGYKFLLFLSLFLTMLLTMSMFMCICFTYIKTKKMREIQNSKGKSEGLVETWACFTYS